MPSLTPPHHYFRRQITFPKVISLVQAVLLVVATSKAAAQDYSHFETHIRPVLVQQCYECHSADKKIKGGLRLDNRAGWETGGDSGPALVPGNPEESLIMKALSHRDSHLQMPPKKMLATTTQEHFRKWIESGAPDPREGDATGKVAGFPPAAVNHWAYQPPQESKPPGVQNPFWPKGVIDHYLLAELEAKGWTPSPDAPAHILARRLFFLLTGLPPTPEEAAAFIADYQKNADEALASWTDRLLATEAYAEQWTRHWLDVARFAESSGGGRSLLYKDAWRYRDYVLQAIREDIPLPQFIAEQIAGDLLPSDSPEQKARQTTATGFLVLGPTNYEEQNKQQLRFDIIDEQLDTIGKTFLGQTIGCARCHDHKFDPVSHTDYYAMAGILANTRTLANYTDNVARWVEVRLPGSPEEESRWAEREKQIAEADQQLAALKKRLASSSNPTGQKNTAAIAIENLPGFVVDDHQAKLTGNWKHSVMMFPHVGKGYLHDMDEGKGTKSVTFAQPEMKSGRYQIKLAYVAGPTRAKAVPVEIFHADGEETVLVDMTATPDDAPFMTLGEFRFESGGNGFVTVTTEGTQGYVTVDAVQFLSVNEPPQPIAKKKADSPAGEEETKLAEWTNIKKKWESIPPPPAAMGVKEDDKIADTALRIRGVESLKGKIVPRGLPTFGQPSLAAPLPSGESGRRELAAWLAEPENPLTARVFVNRIWQAAFGKGLVATPDNFGTTGDAPSHPALLDYLALQFQKEGWHLKKLLRTMVLSRAWRQDSVIHPSQKEALAADPDNRFLWRMNARRLHAEEMRDAMLLVGGNLDRTTSGPNIKGAGAIDANDTSSQNIEYGYQFTDTRRSLYTPAFRNRRHPLFEVFDFGDINTPIAKRNESTVAPQALFFLNHSFVASQAGHCAERLLAETSEPTALIRQAYQMILNRPPQPGEEAASLSFLSDPGNTPEAARESVALFVQALFASLDFRYAH
jgi:hypothetical protein